MVSARARERERACQSYLVLLKKFVSKLTVERVPQKETVFARLGALLATLLPRCADSRPLIRVTAIENVQALLYVDQVIRNPADTKPAHEVMLCTQLRNRMEQTDNATDRLAVVRDLAALLATQVGVIRSLPSSFIQLTFATKLISILPGVA